MFTLDKVYSGDLTIANRMDLFHDSKPVPTSDTILLVLKPPIKGRYSCAVYTRISLINHYLFAAHAGVLVKLSHGCLCLSDAALDCAEGRLMMRIVLDVLGELGCDLDINTIFIRVSDT